MTLTPKQAAFVAAYLTTLNAQAAAIEAGYSEKSAHVTGHRLLSNAKVQKEIQRQAALLKREAVVTTERVIEEVRRLAFANAADYFDWDEFGVRLKPSSELSAEQTAAVAEISQTVTQHGGTIRLKLHDKNTALDKLCKHLGIYSDAPQINVAVAVVPEPAKTLEDWRRKAEEWKRLTG